MNPKPIPWKQAYPDAPAPFTRALEKTLTNLEEIRPARRRIPLRAALVAAVLFSLAAGMATAWVRHWSIADFLRQDAALPPQEAAQIAGAAREASVKNLGSDSNGVLRMTVREAVYDGMEILVLVEVAPEHDDCYPVDWLTEWWQESLPQEELERRTGKRIVETGECFFLPPHRMPTGREPVYEDAKGGEYTTTFDVKREDNSLVYLLTVRPGEGTYMDEEESVFCVMPCSRFAPLVVRLEIERFSQPEVGELVINGAFDEALLTLRGAALTRTPLNAHLAIDFTLPTSATPPASSDLVYFTQGGVFYHAVSDCMGMDSNLAEHRTVTEAESLGKEPCPNCILALPEMRFALLAEDGRNLEMGQSSVEISNSGPWGAADGFRQAMDLTSVLPETCVLQVLNAATGEVLAELPCDVRFGAN